MAANQHSQAQDDGMADGGMADGDDREGCLSETGAIFNPRHFFV
jgi:hypothetical protein